MSTLSVPIRGELLQFAEGMMTAFAQAVSSAKRSRFTEKAGETVEWFAREFERLVEQDVTQTMARSRSAYTLLCFREACNYASELVRDFETVPGHHTPKLVEQVARLARATAKLSLQVRDAWSQLEQEAAEDPLIAHIVSAAATEPLEEVKRRESVIFQAHRVRRKHAEAFKLLA